jgi:hypothetical protein
MAMKQQLKIFPFHFILLPIFFVWHACNEYFGLFPIKYPLQFGAWYVLLALVLFFAGLLLFRNIIKAGCLASFLLVIFFFWGSFHDFIRRIRLPHFMISNAVLLPLILVIIIVLIIYYKKKKTTPLRTNRFLNLLFALFLLMEMAISGYKMALAEGVKNNLFYVNLTTAPRLAQVPDSLKPDIFLFVFDEYASSISLKDYMAFDNSRIDSSLSQHHFYISRRSMSNYNSTPHSLGSMLGLDYFDMPLEGSKSSAKDLLKARYTFENSLLPRLLKAQGYTVRNHGLLDLKDHPAPHIVLFENDIAAALYDETLIARIEKEVAWNWNIPFLQSARKKKIEVHFEEQVMTTLSNLREGIQELRTPAKQPRFVLAHVLLPHEPYFFDRNGKRREVQLSDNDPHIRDSLYLDQLRFANTWIDSIAQAANKPSDRPRIVIIEGDHGRRDDPVTGISYIRNKQFMNLNACYFSDQNYSMLYDSISPVNSFRVVLNKYFQTNLPILKDSTIVLH